jgi:hypothetical protein
MNNLLFQEQELSCPVVSILRMDQLKIGGTKMKEHENLYPGDGPTSPAVVFFGE